MYEYDDGLTILDPDPMEMAVDNYLARQEEEFEEHWAKIELKETWLSMPVHDQPFDWSICEESWVEWLDFGAPLIGVRLPCQI